MTNLESEQFRQDLIQKIKQTPKGERKKVISEARRTEEYWQARTDKIKERQGEEEIEGGLGVFIKHKTLYRGLGIAGIKKMKIAEEETVGRGVYLTSEAKDAIGYAYGHSRHKKDQEPIIYESSIDDMKLLDLRKKENVGSVLVGFKDVLLAKLKNPDIGWNVEENIRDVLKRINVGKFDGSTLKQVGSFFSSEFSAYIQSLGYDGLVTLEGGEGNYVGEHDTYLIFDPEKVKIIKEQGINDAAG